MEDLDGPRPARLAPNAPASLVTATLLLVGGPAGATDQVTLAPDWVIGGTRTPYFVAADKGF
jgi:hypothetical protein